MPCASLPFTNPTGNPNAHHSSPSRFWGSGHSNGADTTDTGPASPSSETSVSGPGSLTRTTCARNVRAKSPLRNATTIRSGADLASAERQAAPLLAEDLARKIADALADGTW